MISTESIWERIRHATLIVAVTIASGLLAGCGGDATESDDEHSGETQEQDASEPASPEQEQGAEQQSTPTRANEPVQEQASQPPPPKPPVRRSYKSPSAYWPRPMSEFNENLQRSFEEQVKKKHAQIDLDWQLPLEPKEDRAIIRLLILKDGEPFGGRIAPWSMDDFFFTAHSPKVEHGHPFRTNPSGRFIRTDQTQGTYDLGLWVAPKTEDGQPRRVWRLKDVKINVGDSLEFEINLED